MFKGKVYIYKNLNGREEKIEREFDDAHEFQSFAKKHDVGFYPFHSPILWLGEWANLQNYFDSLVDRKLGLSYDDSENWVIEQDDSIVNLDKYDQELKKIEYQKQHKEETLNSLKDTLHKLKEYKKKFKDAGQDHMIEDIDADIKKVEEEIENLGK